MKPAKQLTPRHQLRTGFEPKRHEQVMRHKNARRPKERLRRALHAQSITFALLFLSVLSAAWGQSVSVSSWGKVVLGGQGMVFSNLPGDALVIKRTTEDELVNRLLELKLKVFDGHIEDDAGVYLSFVNSARFNELPGGSGRFQVEVTLSLRAVSRRSGIILAASQIRSTAEAESALKALNGAIIKAVQGRQFESFVDTLSLNFLNDVPGNRQKAFVERFAYRKDLTNGESLANSVLFRSRQRAS